MALKSPAEKYFKRPEYNYKSNKLFLFSIAGPSLSKINYSKTSGTSEDSRKT